MGVRRVRTGGIDSWPLLAESAVQFGIDSDTGALKWRPTEADAWRDLGPKSVGVNWFPSGYISGQYYWCNSSGGSSTSGALGYGTARVGPWTVTAPLSVAKLFTDFTVAGDASSVFLFLIYADDGTGRPGARVHYSAAGISTAGTPAAFEDTPSSLVLQPGLYWVGGVVQGTGTQPTMRTVSGSSVPVQIPLGASVPNAANAYCGYTMTGVTATPPTTWTIGTQTATIPRIGFKAA